MQKMRGFTVVEILVVTAVLGILFAIVTVAWAFTLRDSEDDTRFAQHQEWISRFETYRTQNGVYPNSASATDNTTPLDGEYCLGTDFPDNQCGDGIVATPVSANRVLEELSKVGTLPEYTNKKANSYTGPWADYTQFSSTGQIRIYQSYSSDPCPSGTSRDANYTGGVVCYATITR